MANHRDPDLEEALQSTLDRGSSVWVIGDVHGYRQEFEMLLEALKILRVTWCFVLATS